MEPIIRNQGFNRTFVFILSSMRSGSTLLKALLATRSDVSDLPEMMFSNFIKASECSQEPIVVMKEPAYYNFQRYPILPNTNSKKIILVRHPYETIISLHKMNLETNPSLAIKLRETELLDYWESTYSNILNNINIKDKNVKIIRYESLIATPKIITNHLFNFICSENVKGVETYAPPKKYEWKWGSDDGGPIIKTLKVQKSKNIHRNNFKLLDLIQARPKTLRLLEFFGYI